MNEVAPFGGVTTTLETAGLPTLGVIVPKLPPSFTVTDFTPSNVIPDRLTWQTVEVTFREPPVGHPENDRETVDAV